MSGINRTTSGFPLLQDKFTQLVAPEGCDGQGQEEMINALSMGPFSSDRSIREYADNIWGIKPVL